MGQRVDLSFQVQGILPAENGGIGSLAGLKFADNETPSGVVDGSNSTFTLANVPSPGGSLLLFFRPPAGQGILYFQTIDYTLSGPTINTIAPPTSGGNLRAWYRFNQTTLVIRGERLVMSDAFKSAGVSAFPLSDSAAGTLTEGLSFVLRPSRGLFVEDMQQADTAFVVLQARKAFSDTMTLSDGFAKLLV